MTKELSLLRRITEELLCLHYVVRVTQHLGRITEYNYEVSNQKDHQTLAIESGGPKWI